MTLCHRLRRRASAGKGSSIYVVAGLLPVWTPDWRLLLAGEGDEQLALQQLADELGITSHVSFVGRVSSHDMVDFYHQLDVFCVAQPCHAQLARAIWACSD